jgi:hypothetical protein
MRIATDPSPICAPDSVIASGVALDSWDVLAIGIGAAVDFFCAAKAAEGASPRTIDWYRMLLTRAVRGFGAARPVDAIAAVELRAWLLALRSTLAPVSIAAYVRGLKAFGNPPVRAREPPGGRHPSGRDAPRHGQGREGTDRAVRTTARRALVRYLGTRGRPTPADPRFMSTWRRALNPRAIHTVVSRLGRRAGVATRCSPQIRGPVEVRISR